jgi:hypothetical protein
MTAQAELTKEDLEFIADLLAQDYAVSILILRRLLILKDDALERAYYDKYIREDLFIAGGEYRLDPGYDSFTPSPRLARIRPHLLALRSCEVALA